MTVRTIVRTLTLIVVVGCGVLVTATGVRFLDAGPSSMEGLGAAGKVLLAWPLIIVGVTPLCVVVGYLASRTGDASDIPARRRRSTLPPARARKRDSTRESDVR